MWGDWPDSLEWPESLDIHVELDPRLYTVLQHYIKASGRDQNQFVESAIAFHLLTHANGLSDRHRQVAQRIVDQSGDLQNG